MMKLKIIKTMLTSLAILLFSYSAEASLEVHPNNIKDTVDAGSNTSIVHITNVGPASNLNYQIGSDVIWMAFSSTSGSINLGDTVSIIITYDLQALQNGFNYANIFVQDPHHGEITIPVEIYFQSITDLNEDFFSNNPASYSLKQNYPNPFNPSTKISFSIPETQRVTLKIYNLLGNELLTIIDDFKPAGAYSVNVVMTGFASGVYFYKFEAGNYAITKKMILSK